MRQPSKWKNTLDNLFIPPSCLHITQPLFLGTHCYFRLPFFLPATHFCFPLSPPVLQVGHLDTLSFFLLFLYSLSFFLFYHCSLLSIFTLSFFPHYPAAGQFLYSVSFCFLTLCYPLLLSPGMFCLTMSFYN